MRATQSWYCKSLRAPIIGSACLNALLLVLPLISCAHPEDEVVATFRGGSITLAELKRQVALDPQASEAQEGTDNFAAKRQAALENLVLQKVVSTAQCAEEVLEDPLVRARLAWRRLALMNALVGQHLVADEQPPEDIPEPENIDPRFTFRHIFLRLDQPDRAAAKKRSKEVEAALAAGEAFAAVAQRFSDSTNAGSGGLVANVSLSAMEGIAGKTLEHLRLGEPSGVVETRSGLHFFQLLRRFPAKLDRHQQEQRWLLQRQGELRRALLEHLRTEVAIDTTGTVWKVGSSELDAAVAFDLMKLTMQQNPTADTWQSVVDLLLLVEYAQTQALDTSQIEPLISQARQNEILRGCFQRQWQSLLSEISDEQLRSSFQANQAAFAQPGAATVELIFLAQGTDPFATQLKAEKLVAELRQGKLTFADGARRFSTGPGANNGGKLGELQPWQWALLNPALPRLIYTLETQKVSDPVYCPALRMRENPPDLNGGFAIAKVSHRQEASLPQFADAVEEVRSWYARTHYLELQESLRSLMLEQAELVVARLPDAAELSS